MSLALYRKYRPQRFSEVVGQEHVTGPLQEALRTGRVHHAYLFSGPRGCGKTSSARILAKSLNCVDGPTPDPCGKCEHCVDITNGSSIDVIEIDAASHGRVEDTRDLREHAFFSPAKARFKVYIVDEAHMVSAAGFNALLKVVEEPPEHVKFVFATTEPEGVLNTIRSRTHHYPFRLVPTVVLSDLLTSICAQEGITIDPRAVSLVVRAGAGSVRDAQSVLDQLIAGSGPEGVTYDLARDLLGVTDAALLDEMIDAFAARDGRAVFATVARVASGGHDPRRFAGDLLDRLRDLLVVQRAPDAVDAGVLDVAPELLPRLISQAALFGPAELSRAADQLYAGLAEMRGTLSPRLVLELVCARVLLPAAATDESATLSRLDRLERRLSIAAEATVEPAQRPVAPALVEPAVAEVPAAPERPAAEPLPPAPADVLPAPPPVTATSGAIDAAAIRRDWDTIRAAVKTRRATPYAMLGTATATDVSGEILTISFPTSALARQWEIGAHDVHLVDALGEVFGGSWSVKVTFRDAPPDEGPDEGTSPDDDVSPPPSGGLPGDDPAVALLKAGLGATVIGERDT